MNENNDAAESVNIEGNPEIDINNSAADESATNEEKGEATLDAMKVVELTNDLQRTRADFENFRRQAEVQKEHYGSVVKNATIMKFLPLLDDIDRAIVANESLKPLEKSLAKTLKELKLERVESKKGSTFNPDIHDAVMVEGDGDKEVIAETLRAGYRYEGELIRPALVKVEKK
ncbi:nucleotide exchange factor GrpE [Candidatus Saccharibacteria bacterium]|nr:nucleotide exchange factor GrpE [Candidatus Saccharibacteria bacterium]